MNIKKVLKDIELELNNVEKKFEKTSKESEEYENLLKRGRGLLTLQTLFKIFEEKEK